MPSTRSSPAIGVRILRFLDDHRLDHSPAHYAFAHRFLTGDDPVLRDAVSRITDDGVRITAEEVTRLSAMAGAVDAVEAAVGPKFDRLTMRFLSIVTDATDATGALNQDLVLATASMLAPDAPSIELILAAMIERTAQAQARMAEAGRQAQTLRDELQVVRDGSAQDRLTGVMNRPALERRLAERRAQASYCLALVGIDRFRRLNDTHGEDVGDRVLTAVAHMLRDECAPHAVARWSGDQFMILFDGLSANDGGTVVEAVRQALTGRRLKLFEDGTPIGPVDFSAGVVSSRSRAVPAVVAAGEQLLREAKARGRGRVLTEPAIIAVA